MRACATVQQLPVSGVAAMWLLVCDSERVCVCACMCVCQGGVCVCVWYSKCSKSVNQKASRGDGARVYTRTVQNRILDKTRREGGWEGGARGERDLFTSLFFSLFFNVVPG